MQITTLNETVFPESLLNTLDKLCGTAPTTAATGHEVAVGERSIFDTLVTELVDWFG